MKTTSLSTSIALIITCFITTNNISASASGRISTSDVPIPPFLRYLKPDDLEKAKQLAKNRHKQLVQQALDNFPIDSIACTPTEDEAAIANTPLVQLPVKLTSKLPDFHDQLPPSIYLSTKPLLTQQECTQVISWADEHFSQHNDGEWTTLPTGEYRMHGFQLKDVPAIREFFTTVFRKRFIPLLRHVNPQFAESVYDLAIDNCYLMKFTPQSGVRTDIHSDDGCLSFTIAMNPSDEYTGGGTWFEGMADDPSNHEAGILKMDVGHVNFRAGAIRHCGHTISSGTRYVIGGFAIHRTKTENVRLLMRGNTEEEMELTLPSAVALNPEADEPYAMLAHDWIKRRDRSEDEAKEVLEYCFQHVNPHCAKVAFSLGVRHYRRERQYQKVMDCMKICLTIDPYDVDAMIAMAEAADEMNDAETEKEMYQRIVRVESVQPERKANAYRDLGLLYKGKDGDAEIDCYRKSIEAFDNYAARYSLGRALFESDQLELARESFLTCVNLAQDESQKVKAFKALYRTCRTLLEKEKPGLSGEDRREQMTQLVGGEENYKMIQSMMANPFVFRP